MFFTLSHRKFFLLVLITATLVRFLPGMRFTFKILLLTIVLIIQLIKSFLKGSGPYTHRVKEIEDDIQAKIKSVNEAAGIKESDTGLAIPALWDLAADKQALQTEEPLQVGRK